MIRVTERSGTLEQSCSDGKQVYAGSARAGAADKPVRDSNLQDFGMVQPRKPKDYNQIALKTR